MYSFDTHIRVRYGETDKMGYLYYGNYAEYYEVSRVETIRSLGTSYKEMEDSGIMLPVVELKCNFIKPAFYDEMLCIKTTIPHIPRVRILFQYEISNEKKEIINRGETTLVFFDMQKKKPITAPKWILEKLGQHFKG